MSGDARAGTATLEEVQEAVHALTAAERHKLRGFARFRIQGIGRAALGRDEHLLLADAVASALQRGRKWPKNKVDFYGFLHGAMRSISSEWKRKFQEEEARPEAELFRADAADGDPGVVSAAKSALPDPECQASTAERIQQVIEHFKDDEVVLEIIEGLREGMTGPETQELFELMENEYNAGVKRLRRFAQALKQEGS